MSVGVSFSDITSGRRKNEKERKRECDKFVDLAKLDFIYSYVVVSKLVNKKK